MLALFLGQFHSLGRWLQVYKHFNKKMFQNLFITREKRCICLDLKVAFRMTHHRIQRNGKAGSNGILGRIDRKFRVVSASFFSHKLGTFSEINSECGRFLLLEFVHSCRKFSSTKQIWKKTVRSHTRFRLDRSSVSGMSAAYEDLGRHETLAYGM